MSYGTKVKIVKLSREQMGALRLMLKLEWMRVTDLCVKEAINLQLNNTAVTQQVIAFGESYIIMDTPLYEALRELQTTGRETASVSMLVKSYEILYDMIKDRYKVGDLARVPAAISENPDFDTPMSMMHDMCLLFDRHREALNDAFLTASEGIQSLESTIPQTNTKTPLLN
jgi:hypothetical protein